MAERTLAIPASILASKVLMLMKQRMGYSDSEISTGVGSVSTGIFHFHGGVGFPIAWNDVQEINYFNQHVVNGQKLPVPSFPSAGYNQHSHTSEYDGGVLPGITGNHTHSSNRSGGLAFAVFAPSTGFPQADWES